MKVVVLHWTFGNPQENRFPWLQKTLEKNWHQVRVPTLPTPENQSPETRCQTLQQQVPFTFDKDTILIGHSLGATHILNILDQERKEPIKKAILVSWFTKELWNKEFDTLNAPFLKNRNREQIKNNAKEFIILQGDNDPYVPINEAEYLQENLEGILEIIPQWGHINTSAGFNKFNEILKYLP